MSGSTACRPRVSRWRRMMVIPVLVLGSMVMAQAAEVVRTFNSTNVPRPIPEVGNPPGSQAGTTRSLLRVNGLIGAATNISVSLYATHSYPSDLIVRLVPPNPLTGEAGTGQGIILVENIVSTVVPNPVPPADPPLITSGDNRQGFNTGIGVSNTEFGRVFFADGLPVLDRANPLHVNNVYRQVYLKPTETATVPTTVRGFRPQQLFATLIDDGLIGPAINGIWTLLIIDDAGQDSGTLYGWSMTVSEFGPHVWTGAGGNANWSTAGNWVNGNVPVLTEIASTIVFPDVNADGSLVANRTANNDIGDINCATVSVAGGYTLTGQKITVRAGGTITVTDGGNDIVDWGIGIDLMGTATITRPAGSTINLTGVIANNPAAVGAPTFAGAGIATLTAGNTYTGATSLNGGILGISNNTALGTAAAGTTVVTGTTLRLDTAITTAEPLSLVGSGTAGQGALFAAASATTNGDITLAGNVSLGIANGMTLTINAMAAQPAGNYGVTVIGPGALILNDALPANTALATIGSAVTLTAAQPSVSSLSLTGGTITPTAVLTVNGTITVVSSATISTLEVGTINLGGGTRMISVGNGAAPTDLAVNATFTNGGLTMSGGGTTAWGSTSTGVPLSLNGGVLTGSGTVGNLSVGSAKLAMTGAFNVDNCTLGANSWLAFNGPVLNASGVVSINGGVLQPLASGLIIDGLSANTGAFRFYPRNGVVTYNAGDGFDVSIVAGTTASFTTLTYAAAEGGPAVQLALTGNATVAITSAGGGLTPGGDFVEIASVAIAGATIVPLTINDDYIEEGTESGELIIIPLSGGAGGGNSATLTITDNDQSDSKSCGFGTGLTVFLLFGFGLLLHVRLRRP